jgi:hypothetical protein
MRPVDCAKVSRHLGLAAPVQRRLLTYRDPMAQRYLIPRTRASLFQAPRCLRHRGAGQAVMACLALLTLPAPLFAGQPLSAWDQSTKVESADDAAQANAASPLCAPLAANITRRIAAIKSLRAAIRKAEAAPPTSVKSALQGLFGKPEPTAKMIDQERRIADERRTAVDLNAMLRSSNCVPIDIDAALSEQPEDATGGPVVPDAMPNDLVPVPNQY